ncbi:hypothetical protein O181_056304 [Austropuccinia psidii MF-1]|uniref:Uncharacterized protein n=1 Tax=Austropuccinia psidii MF-1 TaxID=1389203 RepID=A0A9Q3E8B5_9BASI|nr:hypothetical protein [Austropuccinia psidii MF-1]
MPTASQRQREEYIPLKKFKMKKFKWKIQTMNLWKMPSGKTPIEENLVEYQGEALLEIHDIHFEAGLPQDTTNENLCKQTQDAQTFQVTPTKGMVYIHLTDTKMSVFVNNSQHPLIIDSGAHFSIVAN